MVRIAVNGALGQMGREVIAQAGSNPALIVVAGIDSVVSVASASEELGCALLPDLTGLEPVDVIIDFSRPSALPALLRHATEHGTALVLGTTGYSEADRHAIEDAAKLAPVFVSPNMSYGVAVLADLARAAVKALGPSFDVEISETHHRRKVDAPSGTALMLAEAVTSTNPQPMPIVLDRPARHEARGDGEVSVVSRRGGTVPGQHNVGLFGDDEVIELSHTAQSQRVLAAGALKAAAYMAGKPVGYYTMGQLLAELSLVTHIGLQSDVAVISLGGVSADPAAVAAVFAAINCINVDMISATTPHDGCLDLAFSVPQADLATAIEALAALPSPSPYVTEHLAKLTVEGEGMAISPGVSARIFACLAECGVSPYQVTTSETKITMAVDQNQTEPVIESIKREFGLAR